MKVVPGKDLWALRHLIFYYRHKSRSSDGSSSSGATLVYYTFSPNSTKIWLNLKLLGARGCVACSVSCVLLPEGWGQNRLVFVSLIGRPPCRALQGEPQFRVWIHPSWLLQWVSGQMVLFTFFLTLYFITILGQWTHHHPDLLGYTPPHTYVLLSQHPSPL